MRILAVDSAALSASVAAVESGAVRAELVLSTGQTHSRHLMEMIRRTLALAAWPLESVEAFAVTVGPGSFTGLRIGISTVKGLSMATGKPAAGVSSLESLALQCAVGELPVYAFIDGRKGEVYCARYRLRGERLHIEKPETVIAPHDAVQDIDQPVIFAGSGALLYRALLKDKLGRRALFAPPGFDLIRASSVAQLAGEKLERGEFCGAENLIPRYIRRPDAEIRPRRQAIA